VSLLIVDDAAAAVVVVVVEEVLVHSVECDAFESLSVGILVVVNDFDLDFLRLM
jgi:hypothetical protein